MAVITTQMSSYNLTRSRSKTPSKRSKQTTAATERTVGFGTIPKPRDQGNGRYTTVRRNLDEVFKRADSRVNDLGEDASNFEVRFPTSGRRSVPPPNWGRRSGPPPTTPETQNQYIPVPIPIPAGVGQFMDMTRWAIAVTPSRIDFVRWASLMTIKALCLFTNFLFWVFAFMVVKTAPTWTGLVPSISALWKCRPILLGGGGISIVPEIWAEVFPEADIANAHSLQVILHQTGQPDAAVLNSFTVPLLVGNPIFWAGATTIMFILHGSLSFIYRCLTSQDHLEYDMTDTD